jgi:hypothetical protein
MNEITLTIGGSVELLLKPAPIEGRVYVTAFYGGLTTTGENMAYTLPGDRLIVVRVDYVDGAGHPATVDGDVTWSTSASEIASVTVDAGDTQQCTITPAGTLGTAQITATADADLGSGSRELVTMLDVTVVAGEAVAGVISPVGEPQPIP